MENNDAIRPTMISLMNNLINNQQETIAEMNSILNFLSCSGLESEEPVYNDLYSAMSIANTNNDRILSMVHAIEEIFGTDERLGEIATPTSGRYRWE